MPGVDFFSDLRELNLAAQWYQKKGPKTLTVAAGMLLNNIAFGSRESLIKEIHRSMTVRQPGFVKTSITVDKNTNWTDIRSQRSSVGSIEKGKNPKTRSSGWAEQQLAKKTRRKRVATIKARSNSKSKWIKPSARMRKKFFSPSNMPRGTRSGMGPRTAKNADQKILIMLKTLQRQKYRAPFIITGHSKIPPGLYQFTKGENQYGQRNMAMLQSFNPQHKQPKRILWMTSGVAKWFLTHDLNREFIKVRRRLINRSLR
jgi:hypothetical protein